MRPSDGYAFFEHEPNAELAVGAPVAWIADNDGPLQIAAPASAAAAPPASEPGERFTRKARKLMKERGSERSRFRRRRQSRCRCRRARGGGARHETRDDGARAARRRAARAVAVEDHGDSDAEARLRAGRAEHGGRGAPSRPPRGAAAARSRRARARVRCSSSRSTRRRGCCPSGPSSTASTPTAERGRYATVAIGFAVNLGRSLRVPVVKDAAQRVAARRGPRAFAT